MKINKVEHFFIRCAGGDVNHLDELNIQPDINKYVGIGLAVLLTGILASLSFGYAISWVFIQEPLCIFLGLIWGLLIFNLDRLIVSGSLKTAQNAFTYYISSIFRILLAVGIAFTISIPIELKLFETKLSKESARLEIESSARLKELRTLQLNQRAKAEAEVAGKGQTGILGNGIVTKFLNEESLRIDQQIAAEIEGIENKYPTNTEKLGLLERFKALESLKQDPDVMKISLGITLLFLLIELIPVLVKLFSTDALYEDKLRSQIRKELRIINADLHEDEVIENVKFSENKGFSKQTSELYS
ncbi:MAG: DUF4407 domain-containing protein [Saprospiraceae bacterium]